MQSLREKVKEMQSNLPLMDGREKGEMDRIVDMDCTITEYGYLIGENEKEYVVFIVAEDPQNFYFGGQVLTEQLKELDDAGFHAEIVKEGLPVMFGKKMSKAKRAYTTVTFYPEPVIPFTDTKSKK